MEYKNDDDENNTLSSILGRKNGTCLRLEQQLKFYITSSEVRTKQCKLKLFQNPSPHPGANLTFMFLILQNKKVL